MSATATTTAPTLPTFPHGVTVTLDHTERGPELGAPVQWRDYTAHRANGTRPVARLTVYPDGRIMATRHYAVRGTLDYAAWAGIIRTLDGSTEDYMRGVLMPGNPTE